MVNQLVTHKSHYPVIFTVPWTEGEISAGIISDALGRTIRIFLRLKGKRRCWKMYSDTDFIP